MVFAQDRTSTSIAIVGGGIGGLCTAIGLGRAGYQVHVFEQAHQFSEIGAGIGCGSNAIAALEFLGVGKMFGEIADFQEPGSVWLTCRDYSNNSPIGEVLVKGCYASVHRARLLEGLVAYLPNNVTTHFSSRVCDVESVAGAGIDSNYARLTVERRTSDEAEVTREVFEVSAIIGCDGVRSKVREHIKPNTGGYHRYSGVYGYRALLKAEQVISKVGQDIMSSTTIWAGPMKHIIAYPIEGGKILNFVGFVSDPNEEAVWPGPWQKPVTREQMLAEFKEPHETPRRLLELIENPVQWAMFDVEPLDHWTMGRITLLGDSAHASLPHNGQGAAQALEDMVVLVSLLSDPACDAANLPAFLQAYEGVRRPRASAQQLHARATGDLYEYRGPCGSDRAGLAKELADRWDWLWLHDIQADVEAARSSLIDSSVIPGKPVTTER
ncbi:FAD/NAD(P)-binding domain-containing protein [Punctularia strigosozonata HHB-11173 SS5]|uniref:FAD/NAD(P)-binding domain-containing protein n=1 Tax=Punctularia strigosozonata (strain HHB-11173) TaxID=741275 RepID=UPI00044173A3|nr:FAD/NAD(P)-binding domain-containing protein [Punctularia strigosozonata HHB-11173 SS5]EIN12962.1 FAD/NAD(P)-binding domain-containing protein [Punctularia strigosozonata HHB-11173 SS5]